MSEDEERPGRRRGREPIQSRAVSLDRGGDATVRMYEPDDYEALVDLYVGFPADQRAMGIPPLGGRERVAAWLDRLLDRGRNLVATRGDDLMGHALVTPGHEAVPELAVFVRPEFQNRGVGTALCRALVDLCRENGHEGITLRVTETNERAARVYEKLGFEVVDDPPEKPWRAMELRFRPDESTTD